MRRATDLLLLSVYLAIAVAPVAAMAVHVHDPMIHGVRERPRRPPWSWDGFTGETYQRDLTAWFEDRLGLKGYSVRVDNSILYHAFDETKPGSQVRIGPGGVLFQVDDIYYYSKRTSDLPTAAQVDALADRVAHVQRRLQRHGKALVPIIAPSKTSVFRDAVPPRWDLHLGQPRPTDLGAYAAVRDALAARGVVFVDARAMLTGPDAPPRALTWGRQARHWSSYGACLVLRATLDDFTRLTGRAAPGLPCRYQTRAWVRNWHPDRDLRQLLNAWAVPPAPEPVPVMTGDPVPVPGAIEPTTVMVATSFGWNLVREGQRSGAFGKIDFLYYDTLYYDWPTGREVPWGTDQPEPIELEAGSPAWRQVALGKDLYVLDLFETYLFPGTYATDFLDQLDRALPPDP